MKLVLLSLLFLAKLIFSGLAALDDRVLLTLTASNFTDATRSHDKLLVFFWSPEEKLCRQFFPVFQEAARILREDGIMLAVMDATKDAAKDIVNKFEVYGFPTLKFFEGEENVEDWEGHHDLDSVVDYTRRMFGPVSRELRSAAEFDSVAQSSLAVLGVFPTRDFSELAEPLVARTMWQDLARAMWLSSKKFHAFWNLARAMRRDFTFAHVFSTTIVSDCAGCTSPALLVYRDWEPRVSKFAGGEFTREALEEFVAAALTPELVELNMRPQNSRALARILSTDEARLFAFAHPDMQDVAEFKRCLVAASKAQPHLPIMYGDSTAAQAAMAFLGVAPGDLPALVVHEPTTSYKWIARNISSANVSAWLDLYSQGRMDKFERSEPVPEVNDGPVIKLVASQMREVVTSGRDVLIHFFRPGCHPCERLKPEWEQLAARLKPHPRFVVAEFDQSRNDVPDLPGIKFVISGHPALWLVRGEDRTAHEFTRQRCTTDLVLGWMKDVLGGGSLDGVDIEAGPTEAQGLPQVTVREPEDAPISQVRDLDENGDETEAHGMEEL